MEYFHEQDDMASSFRHFGVVSNESLRVGVAAARADSVARAEDASGGGGRDRKRQQQEEEDEQQCTSGSRSSSNRRGGRPRAAKSQSQEQRSCKVVLFATPQELGDRCMKFVKEQRSRFHLIRRCAVMLACWPKYR